MDQDANAYVVLNDGETFTSIGGCHVVFATGDDWDGDIDDAPISAIIDIAHLVTWAMSRGYRATPIVSQTIPQD